MWLFSAFCSAQRSVVSHFTLKVFVMQTWGESMFTPTQTVARSFAFCNAKAKNSTEVLSCVTGLNWINPPPHKNHNKSTSAPAWRDNQSNTSAHREVYANSVLVHLFTAKLCSWVFDVPPALMTEENTTTVSNFTTSDLHLHSCNCFVVVNELLEIPSHHISFSSLWRTWK